MLGLCPANWEPEKFAGTFVSKSRRDSSGGRLDLTLDFTLLANEETKISGRETAGRGDQYLDQIARPVISHVGGLSWKGCISKAS